LSFRVASIAAALALGGVGQLAAPDIASGEELPVEILRESPGSSPCDPCDVHVTGEMVVKALPSGVVISRCQDELEGTINHDGGGELTWTGTADGDPGCNFVNCTATGEDHWPLSTLHEVGGRARILLRACYRSGSTEIHCDLLVIIPDEPTHDQQFSTDQLCSGNTRLMQGDWQAEATAHDSLEFVHGEGLAVEVLREAPSNRPCNPCDIHMTGESRVVALPIGIVVSTCIDDLEGTIYHDGAGELAWTPGPYPRAATSSTARHPAKITGRSAPSTKPTARPASCSATATGPEQPRSTATS